MFSSTFSSERLPSAPLLANLQSALLLFLLTVLALEIGLAARGIRPNQEDSESLWLHERARADALGSRALVMIGASRILLDTDLSEMERQMPELEPVQLAIDGVSFLPILRGLAQDRDFHGKLIIDFNDDLIDGSRHHTTDSIAAAWEHDFEEDRAHPWPRFTRMEDRLQDLVRSHLRAYADGSRPWSALTHRILARHPAAQYLIILPNRSVDADYQRLPEPQFYLFRISTTLNLKIHYDRRVPWPLVKRAIADYIAQIPDNIMHRRGGQHCFQGINVRVNIAENQCAHKKICRAKNVRGATLDGNAFGKGFRAKQPADGRAVFAMWEPQPVGCECKRVVARKISAHSRPAPQFLRGEGRPHAVQCAPRRRDRVR